MDAQDAADTHRIESTVVDQPPDRLRMHAELFRHLAYADEPGISACRRHFSRSLAGSTVRRVSVRSSVEDRRTHRLARSLRKGSLKSDCQPPALLSATTASKARKGSR